MRLPIAFDKLTRRFNPTDEISQNAMTTEYSEAYDKIVSTAKQKKLDNEANKDVADYEVQKLTLKEKIYLFFDGLEVRMLVALFLPVLISFFVKKQQIQEPDDLDDDDDDDENDYPSGKNDDLKQVIKLLKKRL